VCAAARDYLKVVPARWRAWWRSLSGREHMRQEEKVTKEMYETKRQRESHECFSSRGRLITRANLPKERAVLGQVDIFSKVFSYC
jgi:hypothetical protein